MRAVYVLFPRNSKLLHLGYKIEDTASHEVDGGNNDDEAMVCSVGQDYLLRSSFINYRCNGRFVVAVVTLPPYRQCCHRFINADGRLIAKESCIQKASSD